MDTIDIREVSERLEALVERAVGGEPFVISKAGVPLVKVVAVTSAQVRSRKRVGFLEGEIAVPDDFDRMGVESGSPRAAPLNCAAGCREPHRAPSRRWTRTVRIASVSSRPSAREKYYLDNGEVAFINHAQKLTTKSENVQIIRALLEIARENEVQR